MGYRIEHFNLADDTIGPGRWSQIFVARGISGLVLASFQDVVPDLQLTWSEFSAVRIDANPQNPHLDTVSANQSHLVRLAFRKANELGYRRIGIAVHALWDERLGDQFMAGYLTEQMKVPASRRLAPFINRDWTATGFARWFARAKPDALLAMNDEVVLGWLKQSGLNYREPFGFASLDLTGPAGPLAGVRKNHWLLGAIAVDTLIGKLQRNERGVPEYPKLTLVEAQWIDGLSLGPAKT
jgi:LacI family transcriptional regulator